MAMPVVKALVTPAIQHTLNESIGIGLGIRYRPMTIFAVQNQLKGFCLDKHVLDTSLSQDHGPFSLAMGCLELPGVYGQGSLRGSGHRVKNSIFGIASGPSSA
jgi:hypothetical protein